MLLLKASLAWMLAGFVLGGLMMVDRVTPRRLAGDAKHGLASLFAWNVIAGVGMVLFALRVAGIFLGAREIACCPMMPTVTYGQN